VDEKEKIVSAFKRALSSPCPPWLLRDTTGNIMSDMFSYGRISRLMIMSVYADMNAHALLADAAVADLTELGRCVGGNTQILALHHAPIRIYTDAARESPASHRGGGRLVS
jgi:hypothetical protein